VEVNYSAYTWWASETGSDPGGTGNLFPGSAFENSNAYKYVKIAVTAIRYLNLSMALAPKHAILANETDAVTVELSSDIPEPALDHIVWEVDGLIDTGDDKWCDPALDGKQILSLAKVNGGKAVEVKALSFDGARTLRIRASFDGGKYTTTATVELLPSLKLEKGATNIEVLEKAVTLNKALETGALLPIVITEQVISKIKEPKLMSLAEGDASRAFTDSVMTGSILTGGVRLVTITGNYKDPTKVTVLKQFKAEISKTNARLVEINLSDENNFASAKNVATSNVRLQILPEGADGSDDGNWITSSNVFKLTVTETWPKVTVKFKGPLSLAFPTLPAAITATTNKGAKVKSITFDTERANAKAATAGSADVLVFGGKDPGSHGGKLEFENGRGEINLNYTIETDDTVTPPPLPSSRKIALTTRTALEGRKGIVEIEGYKPMQVGKYKGSTLKATSMPAVLNITVNAATAMPKLKTNKASYPLMVPAPGATEGFTNEILLLSANKTPFEQGYKVKDAIIVNENASKQKMTNKDSDLSAEYLGNGKVRLTCLHGPTANPKAGTVAMKVILEDPAFTDQTDPASKSKSVIVGFKITTPAIGNMKPTNKAVTVNVNKDHVRLEGENKLKVIDIPIKLNVENRVFDDWGIIGAPAADKNSKTPVWNDPIEDAFYVVPGINKVTLMVDKEQLEKLIAHHNTIKAQSNLKYTLRIGSKDLNLEAGRTQTFNVTLNVIKKPSSFKVTLGKARINISNPASVQAATVTLTNTVSEIDSVKLFEQQFKGKNLVDLGVVESKDFEAKVTGPLKFAIVKKNGALPPPNVAQKLSVKITLKNGQELESWTHKPALAANKQWTDKPIAVNPMQTASKATVSRKDISLYKAAPLSGETLSVKLTTPANVRLGTVSINPASVKALEDGGFRLERGGDGEWTIHFANDSTPRRIDAKGKVVNTSKTSGIPKEPAASYKVGLQLWAEGTYTWKADPKQSDGLARDKSGNLIPVALKNPANNKNASKPTTVNITVRIK